MAGSVFARGMNGHGTGTSALAARRARSGFGALPARLARAGLFLALALAGTAQAQETYVSNIGNATSSSRSFGLDVAQLFTTGPRAGGYPLGSVDVFFYSIGDDPDIAVEIWSTSGTGSNAEPDAKLYDLTTPASIASASSSVLSFTPATSRTLSASTTYAVVLSDDNRDSHLWITTDDSESEAGTSWSIADDVHWWSTSDMSWDTFANPLQIAVKGPADTTTDATLSNLKLEDDAGGAVTLSPMFSSTATS